MDKIRAWFVSYWEVLAQILIGLTIVFCALWYKIGSLTGMSTEEIAVHNNLIKHVYTLKYLLHNPIGSPYTAGLVVLNYLHLSGPVAIRSIGACFGLLTVLAFYYVIWRWHGTLVALLTTLIFTISPWFLFTTRYGMESSLYALATLLILFLGFITRRIKTRSLNTFILLVLGSFLLYIPGLVWFVLVAGVWNWSYLVDEFNRISLKLKFIYGVVFLILISPLVRSIYLTPGLIKRFAGLPIKFIGVKALFLNFIHFPLELFIRNTTNNNLILGHQPLVDIFGLVMIILGTYRYVSTRKIDRLMIIFGVIVLGWILVSFGGGVPIFITMPLLFILTGAGIGYLGEEWFTVFPRNPVARTVGITLLLLMILTVAFYHYNQFYIAWPHSLVSINTYSHNLL